MFDKPRTLVRGTLRAQEICSQRQISVQQILNKNLLASEKFPNVKNHSLKSSLILEHAPKCVYIENNCILDIRKIAYSILKDGV